MGGLGGNVREYQSLRSVDLTGRFKSSGDSGYGPTVDWLYIWMHMQEMYILQPTKTEPKNKK